MSAKHPRGTRLAAAAASSAAAATTSSGGKSGHTLWLRTHNPDGSLIGAPPVPVSGGSSGGGSDGGGISITTPAPASGGKSGATLHARAVQATIGTVEKYFLIGALIVGSVYAIRRFHLLNPNAKHFVPKHGG